MNNRMSKGLSALLCISAALIWSLPSAHADTLSADQQKLLQLQQSKSSVATQIHANQAQALTLKKTITSYNKSLKTVESDIATKDHDILILQNRELTLSQQLKNDQTQLSQEQQNLGQVIRADYENGSVSYLSVLFQANSFSDLLSRIYDLSLVTQEQNRMVASVRKLTDSVTSDVKQVKSSKTQVTTEKSKLQSLEATQQAIVAQKKKNLHVIQVDIQTGKQKQGLLESQIQLTQSQIQAIEAETRAAEQQANNPAYVKQQTNKLVSADVNGLIAFANKFLGTPYVWGGTSPSGFDCSGFTQYVMHHYGVNINRTSEQQFAAGVPVSKNNLQPGDLVFFSTYAAGATHVGIYIGNSLMIDSQDMGVSIDNIDNSYWAPKYIGARRYIK